MPDISMCADSKCPARVGCYRYRAKPSDWQTYADFGRGTKNRCPDWLPIFDESKIRPMPDIEPPATFHKDGKTNE